MIYVITTNGLVYTTKTQSAAAEYLTRYEGVTTNGKDLSAVSTALLVTLYNRATEQGHGRTITKFADRKTAERRMDGILDFLAVPLPVAEVATVATKTPKAPKEPKAKAERRGAPKKEIDPMLLEATIALRRQGKTWEQIVAELEQPFNFIFRVRPIIKQHHPDMVKALGPGSPNYGKKEAKSRVKGERKVRQPSAPVVAF